MWAGRRKERGGGNGGGECEKLGLESKIAYVSPGFDSPAPNVHTSRVPHVRGAGVGGSRKQIIYIYIYIYMYIYIPYGCIIKTMYIYIYIYLFMYFLFFMKRR